jgi:predicted dehydrogenase
VLKARTDCLVKTVQDHDKSRAEACAKTLGCAVAADSRAIWDDTEIDGVFILGETNHHRREIAEAVRVKKPVFVEKPLGTGYRDARISADALRKSGLAFMTGYRTRSEGLFLFLRDEIRKGNFGTITRIRYINCHDGELKGGFPDEYGWFYDKAQAGGGAFLDLGTHALDSLLWLTGERVTSATAVTGTVPPLAAGKDCEFFGEGLLRFASGAVGSVAASWVDTSQPVRCVISGTRGHAHVTDGKLYYRSDLRKGSDDRVPWTDLPSDRALVFDMFVDILQGKGDSDFVTPLEALRVCSVQEAMAKGAKAGRWVVPAWPD